MNRQDLKTISEQAKAKQNQFKQKVCVCCGAGCLSSGSEAVLKKLQDEVKASGKENEVEVVASGCMGPCNQGPLVKIMPGHTIYQKVNTEMTPPIFQEHVIKQKPIENLLLFADSRENPFLNSLEDPFYKKQQKIVLHNS